jgi:hypothetical protein
MKSLILAAMALMVATPSFAQVRLEFGDRGYYNEDYPPPPPRYRQRYGEPYGGYERPYGGYERHGYRQRAYGGVCVTSRGACETPGPTPVGARCRCDIPGFGPKRGNVR